MCPRLCQHTSVGNWQIMVCVKKTRGSVEGCEDKFERHLSILSKVCSQESGCVLQWGILSHLSRPLIPRVGGGGAGV